MAEKLKKSHYNHFVKLRNGKRLAFNAISCGLAEIDDENYSKYVQLCKGNGNGDGCAGCDVLRDNLKRGGFLVPSEMEELDAIKVGHHTSRFGNTGFGLTIIPTINCNFACDYCYEPPDMHSLPVSRGGKMSAEVQKNVVSLCRERIAEKSAFTVTWYGGEPLLARDVISSLTEEFKALCKEKESRYVAGMITNGYLLNRETADFLMENNITFIQVTIDGPQEVHDVRRPLKSGKGTYQTILDNLIYVAKETPISVSIRINVDKRNADSVRDLLVDLKQIGFHDRKNVSVYFGHTVECSKSCKDISSSCMVTAEFSEFMIDAYKIALELGFSFSTFPIVQLGTCGAVASGSAVIEPDGSIQNCWNAVGHEHMKTGDLTPKGIRYNNRYYRWLAWTPFREKCVDCSVLPLCMGGCPFRTLYKEEVAHAEKNTCVWWKYNLKPMLKIAYDARSKGLLNVARCTNESGKEVEGEMAD